MNSKENASAWDKFHFQVKNTTEDLLGVQNRPRLHFIRGDVPSSATFPPKINKETHLNVTHRRTPQCCCAVGRKGTVPAHPYRFPGRKRHPETTPGRYREYQLTISLEIAWEIRASLFSFRGGQQQGLELYIAGWWFNVQRCMRVNFATGEQREPIWPLH